MFVLKLDVHVKFSSVEFIEFMILIELVQVTKFWLVKVSYSFVLWIDKKEFVMESPSLVSVMK